MINIRPHITEKSINLVKSNKYTFIVPNNINPSQIRQLLYKTYKVNITGINSIEEKQLQTKRMNKPRTIRANKKIIVTLRAGDTIPGFEVAREEDKKKKDTARKEESKIKTEK